MRLIDADKLFADERIEKEESILNVLYDVYMSEVLDEIDAAPTLDAVPVIRCKDCKYSISGIDKYNEPYILCQLHERSYGVTDNGFCKWAERAERKEER